jgi:hypothetical protein
MMDEQKIREEAWQEGAEAAWEWSVSRGEGFPDNPYTPEVEYTPSLVEMNAVLLSKFTQLEIWRGEKQREGQLAEHVRVMVVEELERLKAQATDTWTWTEVINDCVDAIKRMKP